MATKKTAPNTSNIERKASVISLKDSEVQISPQGQKLIVHVDNQKTGTHGLSSCVVVMPPGTTSKAHVHNKHELIVVCVEGRAATLVGPKLEPLFHGPGEFLYVPPGVEHMAVNLSPTDRIVVFECRTDPHFNEDVELLPHLEELGKKVVAKLRKKLADGTQKLPAHWDEHNTGVYKFSES